MKQNYLERFLDHLRTALGLLALVTIFFACFIPSFQLDVSADSLLLENDKSYQYYRAVSARYGSQDYLIVSYTTERNLFSDQILDELNHLQKDLSAIEQVASVRSILNAPLLESSAVKLSELADELPTLPDPDIDRELARQELMSSPLYRNRLLSADGTTTALQINFSRDDSARKLQQARDQLLEQRFSGPLSVSENEQLAELDAQIKRHEREQTGRRQALIARIRAILDDYRDRAELHLGGVPMIAADMMRFIRHDLIVFGGATLTILALFLWFVFRQWHWVWLPLLSALISAVISVGFLGLAGWPVTVVSANFFALLLIFTLSLNVHLIVRYRELQRDRPQADARTLVAATLRSKLAPSLFTIVTTMIAFAALVISDIRPVIDFGWMMIVALAVAFIVVFILFPATLVKRPLPAPDSARDFSGAVVTGLMRSARRHEWLVLAIAVLVILLSIAGAGRLSVENRFIDYFHDSTEIYQGMRLIDEKLGGTTPFDVIIDAPASFFEPMQTADSEPAQNGEFADLLDESQVGITATSYWFNMFQLPTVGAIHDYLDALPEIGKVLSLDSTMQLLQTLNDDETLNDIFLALLYERLPEPVKQQLLTPYLSAGGNQLHFAVRVYETDPSLQRQALIKRVEKKLQNRFELNAGQIHLSGLLVLYNNLLQSLFRSQILILGAVFAVIVLAFTLVFGSFRVACIAIVPNLLSALLVLGLLGWNGIPLDIMTITIAAITIGIAVDDTIHYVHRHRQEWRKDGDYFGALERSHRSIGQALYYTTLIISAGFLILVLSDFMPTIYFGLFTALSLLSALVANMTVLPVMLHRLRAYGERA